MNYENVLEVVIGSQEYIYICGSPRENRVLFGYWIDKGFVWIKFKG